MGNILAINKIADDREKAKEITNRVIRRGTREDKKFGDILQEEIDKLNKKATKNPDQSVPSSICKITVPLYHRKEEKLNG
ncbi:hypothetical protein FDA09_16980 [Clostridium botulinum]|uniref:hypothetical protein n=1 Tax=Clostridium botulinum TaxID=1491 RepID=UPI000773CE5A|nr:hypothetical protein [Clostridium botulinum]MBY6948385.1 hypothetical protein [Clostridium botulinum]MBY7021402.1 hypothetical protein [Clostridium botulinum]NFH81793.1 hypothetical protein [Clostridium botulinum]NFH85064.1 hypothetical protein [Clostridium botulinum]NFI13035.1 hypothetical protein [Clostridium botulinum]